MRRERLISTYKTRAAATRAVAGDASLEVREADVAGPFGRFQVIEITLLCERSGLEPARCACQLHAR